MIHPGDVIQKQKRDDLYEKHFEVQRDRRSWGENFMEWATMLTILHASECLANGCN